MDKDVYLNVKKAIDRLINSFKNLIKDIASLVVGQFKNLETIINNLRASSTKTNVDYFKRHKPWKKDKFYY